MKALFKVLSVAVVLTALSTISFAQNEPDLGTLFEKFRTEAKAPCGDRGPALATGKIIIEKFGSDELNKQVIDFVTKKMKEIEEKDPRCKLEKRYNDSYKAKNWPEFITVSKELIAIEKDSPLGLDLLLTLTSVGFNMTTEGKNDTYNNETIANAKVALGKLSAGKTSKTGEFGVFEPYGNKDGAVSWLNFMLGFYAEKMSQKKDSIAYYYKAVQVGDKKTDISPYAKIGDYYFGEAETIFNKYTELRKANNNEDNDETKLLLGLARANADRGIDAFGRAYKIAATDPAKAAAKAGLMKTLTSLYKFRFNIAETAKTPELESYVNTQIAKPMPDPMSEVVPVVEEVKPATTTTTTTTTTTAPTTTSKPTTTPAKTTTTPAKPTSTAPVKTTTSKTAVKTTAVKKKGTR